MREILFRGFHADENGGEKIKLNGETITGDWIEGQVCSDGKKSWIVYDMDFFIEEDVCGAYLISDRFMAVVPETVGQFTGLMDKNGKRIFEGDKVKTKWYGKDDGHGISFNKFDYYDVSYFQGGFCIKNATRRFGCATPNMEVIGNIFEVVG